MLLPPIACPPVIKMDFIIISNGETYCSYVRKCQLTFNMALTDFNLIHEWRKWPLKMISACFLMLSCLACKSVPEKLAHLCSIKVLFMGVGLHACLLDRSRVNPKGPALPLKRVVWLPWHSSPTIWWRGEKGSKCLPLWEWQLWLCLDVNPTCQVEHWTL